VPRRAGGQAGLTDRETSRTAQLRQALAIVEDLEALEAEWVRGLLAV